MPPQIAAPSRLPFLSLFFCFQFGHSFVAHDFYRYSSFNQAIFEFFIVSSAQLQILLKIRLWTRIICHFPPSLFSAHVEQNKSVGFPSLCPVIAAFIFAWCKDDGATCSADARRLTLAFLIVPIIIPIIVLKKKSTLSSGGKLTQVRLLSWNNLSQNNWQTRKRQDCRCPQLQCSFASHQAYYLHNNRIYVDNLVL